MKNLKNKPCPLRLIITDSFIDNRLFTQGKITILHRAAIIPLEEYVELLQAAENYERLAILKPLHKMLQRKEVKIMEDAAYDKALLEDSKELLDDLTGEEI